MDEKDANNPFWRFTEGLPSAPQKGDLVNVIESLRRLLCRDYDYSNKDIIPEQDEEVKNTYQK